MTTMDELPYPSGWFYLARARELAPGSVLTRRFLDEDIVLYRTRGGRLRAVRPHCPRLGAHLGAGGTVQGENLVCPVHCFAFTPEACLEQHPLSERNGLILVWYDPEGAAPTWEVPDTSQAGVVPTAAWSTEVRTHPQEIIENTLDYRYLPVPHQVDVQELDLPNAQGPLLHTRPRLGPHRIRADRTFLMAGLGYLRVELPMPSLGLVSYLWAMHTPTGPRRTRMLVATACSDLRRPEATGVSLPRHGLHRAFARAMLKTAVGKVRQDLRIWNTKRYEPRPRLAANDEGIGLFRHWARQFYPSS